MSARDFEVKGGENDLIIMSKMTSYTENWAILVRSMSKPNITCSFKPFLC
jgi:hypothetical protein